MIFIAVDMAPKLRLIYDFMTLSHTIIWNALVMIICHALM